MEIYLQKPDCEHVLKLFLSTALIEIETIDSMISLSHIYQLFIFLIQNKNFMFMLI